MKKTLIALAAVAVAGTAMAQSTVTMSGRFAAGYLAAENAAGAKVSGLQVTDGHITFSSSEDLGMGLRASASLELKLRGRDVAADTSADGRDATVTLSGGFGAVTLGAVEAGNGIVRLGNAGAPVIGLDSGIDAAGGRLLAAPGNVDLLMYTSPELIKGLRARVQIVDSVGNPGAGGMQNAARTLGATIVGVAYSAGPVAFDADFTNWDRNAVALPTNDTRLRMSGSYNFGVARIGAGFEQREDTANQKERDTLLGVSAPFGNMLVGATYGVRNHFNNTLDAKGWELGAQYNFSRRTHLQAAYRSFELDTLPAGQGDNSAFRVRLMHTF